MRVLSFQSAHWLTNCLLFQLVSLTLGLHQRTPDIGRRAFVEKNAAVVASSCIPAAVFGTISASITNPPVASAATGSSTIASRLENDILNLPPPSYASEFNGIDNTYFPGFLKGTWSVQQTLVNTTAPVGLKYLGGPNGDLDIAKRTMSEAQSKFGVPVQLELRYVSTKWGVAEDRLFNTRARLNAFAGKDVVASVQYANVGGSNRQSVLAMGGTENDPLQTKVTYFKGPAAQKSFLVSHGSDFSPQSESSSWSGYEVQRSIFALTNQNTAPPITTDTELIWQLQKVDDRTIRGRLRIAEYLNAQSDKLYFDARNRAVSLQDYTLDMKRIAED